MPNKRTFSIEPINELICRTIDEYINNYSFREGLMILDPFSNEHNFLVDKYHIITNDIDPQYNTISSLDALDFLKLYKDSSIDIILFDPPYSPRQVSECYKKVGRTVNMQTTQASYWSNLKKEIARIMKPNGIVISCAWNSGGIGYPLGFEQKEILLVAHGGWHNDTIVVVEECFEGRD